MKELVFVAKVKTKRTVTLSDGVFEDLQLLAEFRRRRGVSQASASQIIEDGMRDYLRPYRQEIALMRKHREELERAFEREISLFEETRATGETGVKTE